MVVIPQCEMSLMAHRVISRQRSIRSLWGVKRTSAQVWRTEPTQVRPRMLPCCPLLPYVELTLDDGAYEFKK